MTIHLSLSTSDLLLIAGVLALLVLLLLLLLFGSKPRNNINISQNGGVNQANVSIDQSQTIVTKVKVVRQSAPPPRKSSSGSGSSEDMLPIVIIAGITLIGVAVSFVKHFDVIAFWTRTFSAAVILLCIAMLTIYIVRAEQPSFKDCARFFLPLIGSMAGFMLMTAAQDLISDELAEAARSIPDGLPGLVKFYTERLTDYGRIITIAAPIATAVMILHALYAGLASIRAYGQVFQTGEDETSFSNWLLDVTEWCSSGSYSFVGMVMLGFGFYLSYWMPTHTLPL